MQVLIDYPNSLVTTGIMEAAAPAVAGSIPADQQAATAGQTDRQLAAGADKCNLKKQRVTDSNYLEYPDLLEGSGFVLEGLEEKGLDAKSYIQVNK